MFEELSGIKVTYDIIPPREMREKAVLDKLQEMLPVGIEAVLAPDASLDCPPPQPRQGE